METSIAGSLDDLLEGHGELIQRFALPPRLDQGREPGGQFCWHWNVGRCGFGDECHRALWHYPTITLKTTVQPVTYHLLKRLLELNGCVMCDSVLKANLIWTNHFASTPTNIYPPHSVINHFPGTHLITQKNNLAWNMMKAAGASFVPRSFVLPTQMDEAITAQDSTYDQLWIVKPVGLGEGRGVKITKQIDREDYKELTQEYISRPLTVTGKKTDLRLYILLTSVYPTLDIYIYTDGLLRFAYADYDEKDINNPFVHLCNNAVNRAADRDINESNWTLNQFREWISNETELDFEDIWRQLCTLAVGPIVQIKHQLVEDYRRCAMEKKLHCFELFGYDVLVDENGKCWLLELNGLPDLSGGSKKARKSYAADFDVKTRLLSDAFSMVYYLRDERASRDIPKEIMGGFQRIYHEQTLTESIT
ncbi:hypothetical protein PROFUN_00122 [Planoprotostelium fungivorum]|uniref:C3H1-type domain-containing protein n=1 Tax=Planoprotostelium fungivorum TaxID=1890364 RepID=A0A2P6P0Q9_9EUKA|nr:hypothetical protein PROFUN_00122 [Planoprotostelium fungivorum]